MAERLSTTSRRGILGFLAAIPAVALPAMPALSMPSSISALMATTTWRGCVAEYHAAKTAMDEYQARFDAVDASCKTARGKIVVPAGLRNPWAKAMGWFDMSLDELREDMMARRGGGASPKLLAIVDKELEGVPEFIDAQERAVAPRSAAWELLDIASERFSKAEDALRDFEVRNVAELAEKMSIARDEGSDWIMDGAHADIRRLSLT